MEALEREETSLDDIEELMVRDKLRATLDCWAMVRDLRKIGARWLRRAPTKHWQDRILATERRLAELFPKQSDCDILNELIREAEGPFLAAMLKYRMEVMMRRLLKNLGLVEIHRGDSGEVLRRGQGSTKKPSRD